MPLATFLLVVLPLAAAHPHCLHNGVVYVDPTLKSPPCCSADHYPGLSHLVNRTVAGYSSDSLLDEILSPDFVHFQSSTVASRPRFETVQRIYAKVHIRRLYDVDQKAQQYTLLLDFHWTWRDCRLIFNTDTVPYPLDLHERSELFRQMWTPSVVFVEEAHSTERYDTEENVLIFGDGRVQMRQQLSRQLSCTFDFTNLPWDEQSCSVTVVLPGHDKDQVQLNWDTDPLHMDEFRDGAWEISPMDAWKQSLKQFEYESLEPGPVRSLSALGFGFTLKRKPGDIVDDYLVPTAVYWFCSYCGFWVDAAAAPARVTLALIPILTLNNKMGQLRALLPPINKSFRLGNFMLSLFVLSTVHLLEFVIVHRSQQAAKALKRDEERENVEEIAPEHAEAGGEPKGVQRLPEGVQRLLRRLEVWWLRFAMWAKDHMDFHARWVCLLVFVIINMSTLL